MCGLNLLCYSAAPLQARKDVARVRLRTPVATAGKILLVSECHYPLKRTNKGLLCFYHQPESLQSDHYYHLFWSKFSFFSF